MLIQLIIFILSLLALYYGAEVTVKRAEKIGFSLGLSPMAVGIMIVGFGTSLPELFVSQISAFKGQSDVSLGNILGSNIFNLFFILGLVALISPLKVHGDEFRQQIFFHYGICLLALGVLNQAKIGYLSGLALWGFFVFFLYKTHKEMEVQVKKKDISILDILTIFLGLFFLWMGGDLIVSSTIKIATILKVPSYLISAIMVAGGTSLPELVTSLIVLFNKKDSDLILGNIIGSNIFNLAFIGGSVSIYNLAIEQNFMVEIAMLLLGTVVLHLHVRAKKNFSILGGVTYFLLYAAMLLYWCKSLILEKSPL